ncbi:hypothetical protein [Neorhizobium tomejilense]|uniref:hypothetical protein n=1 Tax=Neorhizobium tomejilense TaxID=2093828 RepID=UPI000CF9FBB9|nr:hypothetical protein [Neorhizobium tomejilense]
MRERLTVAKAYSSDDRSDLVRISAIVRDRKAFPRWSVAKLTCNGISKRVVVLGHDEVNDKIIMLDFDQREDFRLKVGEEEEFSLDRVGPCGTVLYLLQARDPMLRLPAIISVISFLVGVLPIGVDLLKILFGGFPE